MKKRILTLGVVVVLVSVLAVPVVVIADGSTAVTGDVEQGYTFTAPTAIGLGTMTPGTPKPGDSGGWLEGNNAPGYIVKGIDQNATVTAGYMLIEGTGTLDAPQYILNNKLKMGDTAAVPNDADVLTTFLTTSDVTDEAVPFYVSQTATYADPVQSGYTITITFTVTQNT